MRKWVIHNELEHPIHTSRSKSLSAIEVLPVSDVHTRQLTKNKASIVCQFIWLHDY